MRKFLTILACVALALFGVVGAGCNENKPVKQGITLQVGEVGYFNVFGDGQTLSITDGDECVKFVDGYIFGISDGSATVTATKDGMTRSTLVTVEKADWQIKAAPVTAYVGESGFIYPTTDPEGEAEQFVYKIVSGYSVKMTENRYEIIGEGDSELLVRAATGKKAALVKITGLAHAVDLKLSQNQIPMGGSIDAKAYLPDGKEADVEFSVAFGEDVVSVRDGKIRALKEGDAVVVTEYNNEEYRFAVSVIGWQLVASDLTIEKGESRDLGVKSEPMGAVTSLKYEVSGEGIVVKNGKVSAVDEGKYTVTVTDTITGKTIEVAVTVIAAKPVITVSDLTIREGDYQIPAPQIENLTADMKVGYRVISGTNSVKYEDGKLWGSFQGNAVVECFVEGTGVAKQFKVTVIKGGYTLSVDGIRLREGDVVTPEPILLPERQDNKFIYTVLLGSDKIQFEGDRLTAVEAGQATVRCSVEHLGVYCDFTVTVEKRTLDIPDGYVYLDENLYVSVKGGRFKSSQVLDFFTPVIGYEIYYTDDSSAVKADLSNATKWTTSMMLRERVGSMNDYKLTQQVDGDLAWAGNNKNESGKYVNDVQNRGQYPIVNLGYVFNVAVVDQNGKIIYKTIQSYIIFNTNAFDKVPILSISMNAELWFDGIPNGYGTSVYNNVYQPGGGNTPADNAARAHLEFFDTTGSFAVNTQVKVGGGWSRGRPQRTLHLNFNKDENGVKQEPIHFEIFGDRTCRGDETKTLNDFTRFRLWNGGSSYESEIRFNDAFFQNLAEDLNVATAAVRPAIVYLNGEFWGMYYIREHYNDDYFDENYKVKKSNVQYFDYVGRYEVSDGDVAAATAFINEMNAYLNDKSKNFADDAVFNDFFSKYVDEASMTDTLIIQTYAGNWDHAGHNNNHRMWRVSVPEEGNPYTDGKLRFCLHDLDMGMTGNSLTSNYLQPGITDSFRNYNLYNRALENAGYRKRLYDRAVELCNGPLSVSNATKVLDELAYSVEPLLQYNVTRWAQAQSVAAWKDRVNGYAKDWINRRNGYFLPSLKQVLGV